MFNCFHGTKETRASDNSMSAGWERCNFFVNIFKDKRGYYRLTYF